MDWTVTTYLVYLAIALPLTAWVGQTLARHGTVFLSDVFIEREPLAQAVNRLLLVGFYLLNLGIVLLFLRMSEEIGDAQQMIEALSVKIGVVMLVVGAIHIGNVLVFNSIRRRQLSPAAPPVPPASYYAPTYPAPTRRA